MVAARDVPWLTTVTLGVGSSLLFAGHALRTEPAGVEWLFSAYPLVAAALLAFGGVWLHRQRWPAEDAWHVLRWVAVGLLAMLVLAGTTLGEDFVDTGTAHDPVFTALHLGVMGALGGLVTGVYNARFRRRTREHRAAERRFRQLFETAPLPVVSVSFDGTVEFWNPSAERVFGWDADEVTGSQYPLVPPEMGDEFADHLSRLRAGERIEGVRTKRRRKDGGLREVDFWAAPLRGEDGTPVSALALYVDTTDQHRREQQLTVLQRILRHNLRNDLTLIMGLAELVADRHDDPDLRSTAETIRERGAHLTDLSTEATRLTARTETVRTLDVVPRVRRVCASLRAEYPRATVTTSLPDEAPVRAVTAIDDAVREVVENAIVHAVVADPTVTVRVAGDEADGLVHVRVRDEGPGIPDHEWAAVQSDVETDLQHASNLGLWVVHWIVTASGGDVRRTPLDPRGTEVDLRLPAAE